MKNVVLNICTMSPPYRKCEFNWNVHGEFTFGEPTLITPRIVYCEIYSIKLKL